MEFMNWRFPPEALHEPGPYPEPWPEINTNAFYCFTILVGPDPRSGRLWCVRGTHPTNNGNSFNAFALVQDRWEERELVRFYPALENLSVWG